MDSLWRAMRIIEGGQGTSAEAKEMRERVVTAVEERLQAGEMQEPLPQGETGWKEYVQKLVQGRRMGRTAGGSGVGGEEWIQSESVPGDKGWRGHRKIQEYGGGRRCR